jgi:hypothetical protein
MLAALSDMKTISRTRNFKREENPCEDKDGARVPW